MNDKEYFEQEWAKMLRGEVYDAGYSEFQKKLVDTRLIVREYNSTSPAETDKLSNILTQLLGSRGKNCTINQPFRCDYGCNIYVGEDFFSNFNFTVLDEAEVRIGNHVFIGPNVSIYTACHPLDSKRRDTFVEWAEPVTIGNSVWIGGGVTILPGVTIGNGAVIGAGSVVTRDVEPYTLVAGNPARFIKKTSE